MCTVHGKWSFNVVVVEVPRPHMLVPIRYSAQTRDDASGWDPCVHFANNSNKKDCKGGSDFFMCRLMQYLDDKEV